MRQDEVKRPFLTKTRTPGSPGTQLKKKELAIYKQNSNQKALSAAASLEPSKTQRVIIIPSLLPLDHEG